MENSTTQRLTPITPMQIMAISGDSFSMMGIDYPEDVLSPLVSTEIKYVGADSFLNVKLLALLPEGTDGKSMALFRDESAAAGLLVFELQFDHDMRDVRKYDAWYVCYEYPLRSADEMRTVKTNVVNTREIDGNPKTRRGTVTQVLES